MEKCEKNDTNDNNYNNKISDFSINHILNKAGEKYYSVRKDKTLITYQHESAIPMFDWLQYTRYRPPKISRPFRSAPVKRTPGRLPRVPFTPNQLSALEDAYKISTYLSSEEANKLALELNLTNTRVKIWFQNRRARERREKREQEDKLNGNSSSASSPEPEVFMPCYMFRN